MNRRALIVAVLALLILASCGSEDPEQAQVVAETPTAIPTTPPVAVPTSTPIPPPTPTPIPPPPTATALPTPPPTALPPPTVAPTTAPAPTVAADPTAIPVAEVQPAPEVIETPTPIPTATTEAPPAGVGVPPTDSQADAGAQPTTVTEAPTAVVASSGETPLECFDRDVQVYRALVDGVDVLTFEGGRVYCSGAGTAAVSAAASYRHSSGLVIQRNGDYIIDNATGGYIPYSGTVHFCVGGQSSTASVRADTVPQLLIVIDNETARLVGQGARGPASFTSNGSQC